MPRTSLPNQKQRGKRCRCLVEVISMNWFFTYIRGYIDMLLVSVVRNNTCFRQPHGMVC